MNRKLFSLILLSNFLCISLFAQETEVLQSPNNILKSANELFGEQNYAPAYQLYEKYLRLTQSQKDVDKSTVYYSKGLCAIFLSQNGADNEVSQFLTLYPKDNRINMSLFYLAGYYEKNKNYVLALQTYNLVQKASLNQFRSYEYDFKKGYCLFNMDSLESAKTCFAAVKDTKSSYASPSTYYYAHILYTQQDYDNALKEFKSLKNDRHFGKVVPYYIVQILYIKEDYAELVKQARTLSEGTTDSKHSEQVNKMLGEAYCKLERYSEAIPYLEKGVKDNPVATQTDNYLLGFALCHDKRYSEAIAYLDKATKGKDSLSQNALYNIGYCYLNTDNKVAARSCFKMAYDMTFDEQIKQDALFNFAKLSYEQPYNESIKAFQTYINDYPKASNVNTAKEYLAQLYGQTRNYKDAIELMEQLPKRSDTINAAYQRITLNRGIEVFNESKYEQAITLFDKSLKYPFNRNITASAQYLKAESNYRLGNYTAAIKDLNAFYRVPEATKSVFYSKANYSMAYNLFKQKKYQSAQTYFTRYIDANEINNYFLLSDAHLRRADCYFMQRKFDLAQEDYSYVITANKIDVDYASYQKALCVGAAGNIEQKKVILEKALNDFPSSSYRASILFEQANCYLVLDQTESALETYQKVVKEYPNSVHVKACISKIGMIYYKQGKDELALQTLDKLVKTYPQAEESKASLANIRSIYVDQNKVNDYYEYIKTVPQASYTASEKDSATYQAVENVYMDGNFKGALGGFRDYLNKFPQGIFALNANYYLADCWQRENMKDSALVSYLYVCSAPKSLFTEKSLLNAAQISYANKDYKKANELYLRLSNESEANSHKQIATSGIMRTAFALNEFDTAITYANKVLEIDKMSATEKDEANYIIASSKYSQGDTATAMSMFKPLKKSKVSEYSGKASYVFAENAYVRGDMKTAEKLVLQISAAPTSEYWLAKSIILLGDIYQKKNKPLIAKQTYQSIVDNYDGADLVIVAKEKILEIDQQEALKKAKEQEALKKAEPKVDEVIIDSDAQGQNQNNTVTPKNDYNNE
jgi:Uncharacterized protein conserved in bacteria